MKIGVLGTGIAGRTIAAKLLELGHDVRVSSRAAKDDAVTFADAASFGEIVFNCTAGDKSLEALRMAEADNLADKTSSTLRTRSTSRKGCRRSWPSATRTAWASRFNASSHGRRS